MNKSWYVLFLSCAGIVIGSLISSLTKAVSWLSFLSYGLKFGLQNPVVLDLGVLQLTIGFSIDLTIAVILMVGLSLFIGLKVIKIK